MSGLNEYSDDADGDFFLDDESDVDTVMESAEGSGARLREHMRKRGGALHRIERRRDRDWLREQLSDWDDYD
jgi:hypothetical protein